MRNFTIFKIILLLIFSYTETISAQIVIGAPSLGFSQACASDSFNTYNVTFSFSPESALGAANQFIIELSDETGSFANPTIVFSSNSGAVTVSPATLSFSLPNTTSGEGFKIRIKSTAPVATSSNSIAFPAYFKIQDTPFSINNLVSTGAYCSDSSYLLTIDNPGYGSNDSPLQYPSLTFNWYKETSPTTSVFVATGSSLSVSEPGTYFVETNYGTCTSNSFSNRVTVTEATSSATSSISSSLGNPYCSSQGSTTLSTIAGNSYQWYKDGTAITGATSQMYITNEAATYSVTINLGSCVANASIDLQNNGFTSSIDVTDTNIINEGETLLVTVTTTANSPDFQWYLNESIISGANGNSFEVTEIGNYKVVVSQTSGCISSTEFLFNVTEPFPDVANIPNLISPNGDGINDTWVIPLPYVSGSNTEVIIYSSQGKVVLSTKNYLNNWPLEYLNLSSVNEVYYYIIIPENSEPIKGAITIIK